MRKNVHHMVFCVLRFTRYHLQKTFLERYTCHAPQKAQTQGYYTLCLDFRDSCDTTLRHLAPDRGKSVYGCVGLVRVWVVELMLRPRAAAPITRTINFKEPNSIVSPLRRRYFRPGCMYLPLSHVPLAVSRSIKFSNNASNMALVASGKPVIYKLLRLSLKASHKARNFS